MEAILWISRAQCVNRRIPSNVATFAMIGHGLECLFCIPCAAWEKNVLHIHGCTQLVWLSLLNVVAQGVKDDEIGLPG